MDADELAIRDLVATWLSATKAGDVQAVLDLMTDDVIFLVSGSRPFGKEAFARSAENLKQVCMDFRSDDQEVRVLGNWAYLRNFIEMTVTPPNGTKVRRAGHTLTILRKETDGRWRIARDANLLTAQSPQKAVEDR